MTTLEAVYIRAISTDPPVLVGIKCGASTHITELDLVMKDLVITVLGLLSRGICYEGITTQPLPEHTIPMENMPDKPFSSIEPLVNYVRFAINVFIAST